VVPIIIIIVSAIRRSARADGFRFFEFLLQSKGCGVEQVLEPLVRFQTVPRPCQVHGHLSLEDDAPPDIATSSLFSKFR
jgi:hypothetical protein